MRPDRAAAPALITGLGVVSAAGSDLAGNMAALASGERRPSAVRGFESRLACPVFEALAVPRDETGWEGLRSVRLALIAAEEAVRGAGLDGRTRGWRVGVCMGTTVAAQLNDLGFYRTFRDTGGAPMDAVRRFLRNNLAERVARELGVEGPCCTVVNACSSGADAIGLALAWLRAGSCDMAIAGGADELSLIPLCGFHALGVASDQPCMPFDRERKGLNLGEGAGVMVLETFACARARGVRAEVELAGYGSACDAYHLTAPRPDGSGLEAAIRQALDEGGLAAGDLAFVNVHGTATRDNDRIEGTTLARVLGPGAVLVATKGYTGHTLGAAGAIEAVYTAVALQEGWVPAAAGFRTRDEEIPLAPLRERTVFEGEAALSTSLAFGGNNAALLLRRVGGGRRP